MAIGGVILLTIIGTIVGTNLFNAGMSATNTEQFCSDCHTNDVVPGTKIQFTLATVQV